MLDVLGIFLSGIAMLFVIVRAAQLNITMPWFEELAPESEPADAKDEPVRGRPSQPRATPTRPMQARSAPPRSRR